MIVSTQQTRACTDAQAPSAPPLVVWCLRLTATTSRRPLPMTSGTISSPPTARRATRMTRVMAAAALSRPTSRRPSPPSPPPRPRPRPQLGSPRPPPARRPTGRTASRSATATSALQTAAHASTTRRERWPAGAEAAGAPCSCTKVTCCGTPTRASSAAGPTSRTPSQI